MKDNFAKIIYLPSSIREDLKTYCRKKGLSQSAYIRGLILRDLEEKIGVIVS